MRILQYFLSLIFITQIGIITIKSQYYNSILEFYSTQKILGKINEENLKIYTSLKPIFINVNSKINDYDSVFYYSKRDNIFSEKLKSSWIYRKLRNENFIEYKSENFTILINPILNLEYTKSKDYKERFFINTRGFELKGSIAKKVYYYSAFYENQARFIPYINNYVKESLVAPGQGAVKILQDNKYDFSRVSAYLNFDIYKNIALQFGHYKHFIGNGYRSLLLSDNSFNYPFLKISLGYKNFRYILLWSQYQLFKTAYYNYHSRKYSSISYLSWMPKTGLEISLFESIMWPGNTANKQSNFNLNYFNPIILSRTAIYGLNNEKNILLGLNLSVRLYKYSQIYTQLAIDDIDSKTKANNNYAFQIGIKHFDLFHNKLSYIKLFVNTEFNYISPYTYTWKNPLQSYTHYNQTLAHPAGSGLYELVAIASFMYRDFSLNAKAVFLTNSIDSSNTNYGSNVFMPNVLDENIISHKSNKIGQGIKREIFNANVEMAYTINPINHLQIFAGIKVHSSSSSLLFLPKRMFFSIGLKTNINNYYHDY